MIFRDLKNIEYKEAWEYQEKLFKKKISTKVKNRDLPESEQLEAEDYLLFCEHPHVYTLGKSGTQNNLLINDEFLSKINATYFKTDRGGDITYHGLGQLVGYPIIDLEKYDLRVRSYIEKMEDVIIKTISEYGIKSSRLENATGVWLDAGIAGKERKISAIGVKVSRLVSMHGFALNINTDLSYFNHINPCGFVDKGVTSMQNELSYEVNFEEVKERLKENFLLFLKQ